MKKILGMLMLALSGAALAQAKPYALIEPKSVDNLGCWAPALAPMDQVFGYSALGHVFLRNTHSNEYFVLHPFKRASKGYGVFASIDAFKRDVLDEPGFQDYVLRPDHVAKLRKRLGALKPDEIYIPEPYPFLGGSAEPATYSRGNVWVFLDIVAQMLGVCENGIAQGE